MKYYNFLNAFNTPLPTKEGNASTSDKNDLHKYVVLYDYIINSQYLKKQSPLSILEIGVREGDSIKVWDDSPVFDKVVGVDIESEESANVKFSFSNKVTLEMEMDGYDPKTFEYIDQKYSGFDIILDDGDHMWESQVKFFELYFPLLNPGGVIICEDIAQTYLPQLNKFCQEYEDFYVFDLRTKSNIHGNEIVAIIKNTNKI
jgi:predicted O-methyltransferase YrrM|tara:strand:- start:510 stop:1115 length:606 start_codon:yes stop_codon:yes gene_type:complete